MRCRDGSRQLHGNQKSTDRFRYKKIETIHLDIVHPPCNFTGSACRLRVVRAMAGERECVLNCTGPFTNSSLCISFDLFS